MSTENEVLLNDIRLDEIEGILIDIDDTIYKYEPNHLNALMGCHKEITKYDSVDIDFNEFKSLYRNARNKITEALSPLSACRSRALAFDLLFDFCSRCMVGFRRYKFHQFCFQNPQLRLQRVYQINLLDCCFQN